MGHELRVMHINGKAFPLPNDSLGKLAIDLVKNHPLVGHKRNHIALTLGAYEKLLLAPYKERVKAAALIRRETAIRGEIPPTTKHIFPLPPPKMKWDPPTDEEWEETLKMIFTLNEAGCTNREIVNSLRAGKRLTRTGLEFEPQHVRNYLIQDERRKNPGKVIIRRAYGYGSTPAGRRVLSMTKDLFNNGHRYVDIAIQLNAHGLRTYRGYKFHGVHVRNILTSEKYLDVA